MSKINPDQTAHWFEQIQAAIHDKCTFIRATITFKENTPGLPCLKAIMRPVMVRKKSQLQISMLDGKKDISRNYSWKEGAAEFEKLLVLPFKHIHIHTVLADLQGRRTRKGKLLISKMAATISETKAISAHNRGKNQPISDNTRNPFFQTIGLADAEGNIIPQMRPKFRQVNQFLRVLEKAIPEFGGRTLHILDCGSGSAWLTFSAYHYLHDILCLPVQLTGIDSNEEVIEKSQRILTCLGWSDVAFQACSIDRYQPIKKPDIIISLHACDTATDAAIALGILQGSDAILAAPCCQHELHHQLKNTLFNPILRHGILRERMADILTDALRSLILSIMGYRTTVMEFIDPMETTKNLLIRAQKKCKNKNLAVIEEYKSLCQYWSIKPALETMLGTHFSQVINSEQKQGCKTEAF